MGKDFYSILGISKTASDDEIKEAHKLQSSKYHPDNNKEKDAEDKLKEITRAYDVLSDKIKRQNYDRFGDDGIKGVGHGDSMSNGRHERPKSYTRPTVKSNHNHVIIQNALSKVLEGAVNAELLKKMQTSLAANLETCEHFLILFRNRLQFRGLYKYDEKQHTICKLDGIGPKSLTNEDLSKYYKFDSPKREFVEVQTKHISLTIIAFTIHDHLWPRRPTVPTNNK